MSSRFSKRIKLFPGFRLNFGKRGISATIGRQGASFGIGRQGIYSNLGIKGTGLSFRTKLNNSSKVYNIDNILIRYLINDYHQLIFVNHDGIPISPVLEKKIKKAILPELIEYIHAYADEYNHELFLCTNQHLLSPSPDDNLFQLPEFEIEKPVKPEFKKPGFFEKLFRQEQQINHQNGIIQEIYNTQLENWNKEYNQYLQ